MLNEILEVVDANNEQLTSEVVNGFNIVNNTFSKVRKNWQSYVLTPFISLLRKSGFHAYTHIQGVKIPAIPHDYYDVIQRIVPFCNSECNQKYRERCLEKSTTSEIDALVIRDTNVCLIEHATNVGGLCWDIVKLFKLSYYNKINSCLFMTWYNTEDESHLENSKMIINLGENIFNPNLGEKNWAIIFLPYFIEEESLNTLDLEYFHNGSFYEFK